MELTGVNQGLAGLTGRAAGGLSGAEPIRNPFPSVSAERLVEGFASPALPPAPGSFGDKLEKALSEVEAKGLAADVTAAKYASGEAIPVHKVIIAAEQARLSIALAAEVRNKALEAYQELVRTPG